jgi:universal stress protein E
MNSIASILVIVDPTAAAQPAVTKAALLAEKFGARLELFLCDTRAAREARVAAHMRAQSKEPLVTSMKSVLEALAAPLRARGLDVATETDRADSLHVALSERVRKTNADLVIKDTHHHTLAQRTFLTNTDWQLIRGCAVPLLLTKARPWAAAPRVLAAIDPGHVNDKPVLLDRCILQRAAYFAQALGGELHALHVFLPVALVATATSIPPMVAAVSPEAIAYEREIRFKEVAAVVAEYAVNAGNIHLEMGGPAEMLPRCAMQLNADIVAMGAISRSGIKRMFIGSTAEDVLERLPCDALIVKTPDFVELLPF